MELIGAVLATVVLVVACATVAKVVLVRVLPGLRSAGGRVVVAVVVIALGVGLVLTGDVGGWDPVVLAGERP